MGTRFEGVFLHGGSFNAITRSDSWRLSFVPLSSSSFSTPSSPPPSLRSPRHPPLVASHPSPSPPPSHNRHPPLPRPRTYFSSYFIFICFSPPRSLVPLFLLFLSSRRLLRAPLLRCARHSALFSFYRQQSWLMQYPPPRPRNLFYFAFEYSIALPRRGNLATGGRQGEEGEKGDDTPEPTMA